MFGRTSGTVAHLKPLNNELYHKVPTNFVNTYDQSSNIIAHNQNFRSSNIQLNRILERRNSSHPLMERSARNSYSPTNFMTIQWISSLDQRMLKDLVLCHL